MEAVPRLHMLWFALKSSPEGTSFANLKKYIAESYQEDPESYSKEVFALETLRNQSMHPTKDGCNIMKRYYCQLHSLQNRFPQLTERGIFTFTWKDLYQNHVNEVTDLRFELAAVLFNVAASHTQVGASVTRGDVDGMKMACTHFQCAAWAFGELRERYSTVNSGGDFMTTELLVFMQQVSFAQAQECILEKSLIDNRKPNIVAKVTAQIVVYYSGALAALLTGGDDGPVSQVIDLSVYKLWKKYVRFKISYLNCILYLYQGQHAEEQQKMGERVTLYQAAWDKLEEARKESKGLPDQKEINESLIFTADVVEAKRKNAKNENEFIYHEAVPELSTISAVQGANLVNGISFSITDPEVAGDDIFARLVPMKAHEASSMYSEEKAKLLRKYGAFIEDKDMELVSFMSSLALENLNINEEKANKIPQGIVDRCAALNANKAAIPDLIAAMSQLAEICADVEMNLKEISFILAEEEQQEQKFQMATGVKRTPNAHITELAREYQKYNEAHLRAGESNDTLRKAMELHVNNLKILARPLQEIQQSVPKLSSELNTVEIFKDVKLILNKVNEMKAQRSQFHADLRIAVNEDDITAKVIAHGTDEGLQTLFDLELAKHERLTQLLDQNLLAQKNILQALTESYAKAAPVLKTLSDVKHKRESFFSSLAASYDVYEDLLAKSAKGLEFYKKLSGNVQKLLTRFKAARDVQSEERQQRMKSMSSNIQTPNTSISTNMNYTTKDIATSAAPNVPKLRDYLKSKNTNAVVVASGGLVDSSYGTNAMLGLIPPSHCLPSVRPNPLGSEAPPQSVCSEGYYSTIGSSTAPNEPPPPYSLQQTQYYDANAAGYTNPIYQQQQQNIAPPAYTLQASPNSQQFNNINASMANLSVQNNYNNGMMQQQQLLIQQQQQQQQQPMPLQQQFVANSNSGYQATASNSYSTNLSLQKTASYGYGTNPALPTAAYGTSAPLLNNAALQGGTQPLSQTVTTSAAGQSMLPICNQYPRIYDSNSGVINYTHTAINGTHVSGDISATAPSLYPVAGNLQTQNLAQTQTPGSYAAPVASLPASEPLYISTAHYENIQSQLHSGVQVPFVTNVQPSMGSTVSADNASPSFSPYEATTKHPGYSYNPQTGNYEYGSGYHQAASAATQHCGQYTHASAMQLMSTVGTTDSEGANKMNVATGFDTPIISHAKSGASGAVIVTAPEAKPDISYYTLPYGYQSQGSVMQAPQYTAATASSHDSSEIQQNLQTPQHSIYMQSGSVSIANTQTTKSAAEYASSVQQVMQIPITSTESTTELHSNASVAAIPPATQSPTQSKTKSSNIDLLTDVNYSGPGFGAPPPTLPEPFLKPEVIIATPPSSQVLLLTEKASTSAAEKEIKKPTEISEKSGAVATSAPLPMTQLTFVPESPLPRKSSCDNISIGSDLSSLDNNFDWDSVSMHSDNLSQSNEKHTLMSTATFLLKPLDPFSDDKALKYFHKEVERFEKSIESLNVKMLNGNTQLLAKWKELEELLAKESVKRTTTIGKLFPEKNRSLDCLPYDHARIKLEKNTDDYINAAYIKNLGTGCPNLIIAQTPQQNTLNDFWSMVWSQKSRTVVCLHTSNEMLDPFWPQDLDAEMHFDDYTVKCVKINALSHCTEYNLKLSMHSADALLGLSVLQIKAWTKSSPSHVIGLAHNAIYTHQHHCLDFNAPNSPLIMNCLTGSERSELVAIAICAILATQTKRPLLINVVDAWQRICSQRQNALRDTATLEQSMQIVLSHAHDVLNKRGIITSYQMKIAPQVASKEKEEIKDPLNELDPLWKLK